MQPDPGSYLRSLLRELGKLIEPLDAGTRQSLDYYFRTIVGQLIVRDQFGEELVNEFASQLKDVLPASILSISGVESGYARRRRLLLALETLTDSSLADVVSQRLVTAACQADKSFHQRFAALADSVLQRRDEVREPPVWTLTPERLEAVLAQIGDRWSGCRVTRVQPVGGLHAKEIYFVNLQWMHGEAQSLVVRCDREVNLTGTRVADEHALLETLYARGFQVPEVLGVMPDIAPGGRSGLIMRRIEGREKGIAEINNKVQLLTDLARLLARLHTTEIESLAIPVPTSGGDHSRMWQRRIEEHYITWRQMCDEPTPIMWRAKRWLESRLHTITDAAVLVHGDFSLRNLLLDASDRVVGVLDWELAHIGHPAADLGYLRSTVESSMCWSDFAAIYRAEGGREVTQAQLDYFEVWGLYRNAVFNATGQHEFVNGRTTDVALGASAIVWYPRFLTDLCDVLDRVS